MLRPFMQAYEHEAVIPFVTAFAGNVQCEVLRAIFVPEDQKDLTVQPVLEEYFRGQPPGEAVRTQSDPCTREAQA